MRRCTTTSNSTRCHSSTQPRTRRAPIAHSHAPTSIKPLLNSCCGCASPRLSQILGNLKIVTTGVLFRVALGRHLTRTQWIALLLLTLGATISQIGGCGGETALSAPMTGYALGCVSACLSATAGVYTEFLLKRNSDSLYWQNAQLYFFGVLFNALNLTMEDVSGGFQRGFWMRDGLRGFNGVTWMIVINFSFSGLFVSWLQKHADTIVKVYSTSSAMLLTALVSLVFFRLEPTLQLFVGIAVACCSLSLYFNPPELERGGGVLGGPQQLLPLTHAGNGRVEVHCPKCYAVSSAVLPRGFMAAPAAQSKSGGGGGGAWGGATGAAGAGGAQMAGGLPPIGGPPSSGAGAPERAATPPPEWAGAQQGHAGGSGGEPGAGAVVVNTQAEPFSAKDAARRSPSGARRRAPRGTSSGVVSHPAFILQAP